MFYGHKRAIYVEVPEVNISEDDDLSDYDNSQENYPPEQLKGRIHHSHKKSQWEETNLFVPAEISKFTGNTDLPEEVSNLDSLFQYFMYFFIDNILDDISKVICIVFNLEQISHFN